jgi:UDP-N-acetylmuramoyl-L-alanyl-D-glutamate--2,6-diaminopimelate ligase
MALTSLEGLLADAGVGAEIRADRTTEISGLSYDSRQVAPGDLFCCIPGAVADGHAFAPAAVAAGASALLVERLLEIDVPQARVASVRRELGPLADAFFGHPSSHLQIAAVTGTNGKTTTTYIFESIAKAAGRSPGVLGNVTRRFAGIEEEASRNTPEAIDIQRLFRRMADAGADPVVIEATSEGLVADRLRGTKLHTAAFTNLTQDHLNTHGSMEAYFEAKALLFEDGYTSRAVVNIDDPYGRLLHDRVANTLDVLTFGDGGDISCASAELTEHGSRVELSTPQGEMAFSTHLVGPYNVSNCMCAIGMALHCGIPVVDAVSGIEALTDVPGRLERIDAGQPFLALVDYAHTPDALEQALGACRALVAKGRVIVVFGCGGDRDRSKRPQMGEIATRLADLTFITSDNPRSEEPAAIVAEVEAGAREGSGEYRSIVDRTEAIGAALAEARQGDVVLVAGKGHEQGQQFADRTIPFDDRAVVRGSLEAKS